MKTSTHARKNKYFQCSELHNRNVNVLVIDFEVSRTPFFICCGYLINIHCTTNIPDLLVFCKIHNYKYIIIQSSILNLIRDKN